MRSVGPVMRDRLFRAAIVIFVLAAVGLAAFVLLRTGVRVVRARVLDKHEESVDISALVTQIRELSRLETASMRIVQVSKTDQTYGVVPGSLAGDSITLMAVGDVIAGIDLSHITEKDVRVSPDRVLTLRLPPATILVTRIDNTQTHVLTRKTGMLTKADEGLEGRARQHAEAQVRRESLNRGILDLASANAEKKLASFLHTIGFEQIRFEHAVAPAQ
ncbi:MAG: DUF4230 domain-containing protein [Acidobacteriota bacterium]